MKMATNGKSTDIQKHLNIEPAAKNRKTRAVNEVPQSDDDNNNSDDVSSKSYRKPVQKATKDVQNESSDTELADSGQKFRSPAQQRHVGDVFVEGEKHTKEDLLLERSGNSRQREVSDDDGDRRLLTFNVGGTIFQTRATTLIKRSGTRRSVKLADRDFLSENYDAVRDEYFLDRDPEVFGCVLNFMRSGHLHIPSTLCGYRVKEELEFWGVSAVHIEPCCWNTFNSWTSTMEFLRQLERDRKVGVCPGHGADGKVDRRRETSRVAAFRLCVWGTLTNPTYSLGARIYGWLALLFVMLAIFSFCASTHPYFRRPSHNPIANVTSGNVTNNVTTTSPLTSTSERESADGLTPGTEVHPALWVADIVCLVFFTLEFICKLACSPQRARYLRSFTGVVDVLALCPDYVEFLVLALDPEELEGDSHFMHVMPFLRLMRVFRIFRLIHHVPGLWIMLYTLKASYNDLCLMLVFLLVGTLLFASLIYFVDDREMFPSIPHGFWWAIVTMTTVGYGDMYPLTGAGYLLGSATAVCGVLMIGFTVPALVNNFIHYYQHVQFALHKEKLRKQQQKEEEEKEKEEEEEDEEEEGQGVGRKEEGEEEEEEEEIGRAFGVEEKEEEEDGEGRGAGKRKKGVREEGTRLSNNVKPSPESIPLVEVKTARR